MTRLDLGPEGRRFARMLDGINRRLRAVETGPQLAYSAIENGSISEYDGQGNLMSVTGRQHDGTHGSAILDGPIPAPPTAPTVIAGPGGLSVTWDGRLTDSFGLPIPQPLDLEGVEIFAAMGQDPTSDLAYRVGGIVATGGGTKAITPLDAGTWHVALRSRTVPGKTSVLTSSVVVEVVAPVDPEIVWEVEAARELAEAAQVAANDAAGAADTARETAEAAEAAAAAAAGVAAGKGDVLIQSAAPVEAMRKASTLWIDTTGGANTPKRWSGSAWVAVTDKAATDAASAAAAAAGAASAAQTDAEAAQSRADSAHDVATAAGLAASGAQTTANGKNRVTYSTAIPTAALGTAPGDLWFRLSGSTVIAMYEFTGGAWVSRTLANAVIATLDAAKITTGLLNADRIAASSITAVKIDIDDLTAAAAFIQQVRALGIELVDGDGNVTVSLTGAGANYVELRGTDGSVVTSLSQDGGVTTQRMSTSQLIYKGDELQTLLDRRGRGIVAWGPIFANQVGSSNGGVMGIFQVSWIAEPGRMYVLHCSPLHFVARGSSLPSNSVSVSTTVRVHLEQNGGTLTISSPVIQTAQQNVMGAGTRSINVSGRMIASNPTERRTFRLGVSHQSSGWDSEIPAWGEAYFYIEDVGPSITQTGGASSLGGTAGSPPVVAPPAPVQRYDTGHLPMEWWKTYRSNGSQAGGGEAGGNQITQGKSPYYSERYSALMGWGTNIQAALAGAVVEEVWLYLSATHWHANNGGMAVIGVHGHGSTPGTFSHIAGNLQEWFGKPQARWVLLPSSWYSGFQSGAYRGISLSAPDNSSVYYGQFGTSGGHTPLLRFIYRK